jgi:hypothetical protein
MAEQLTVLVKASITGGPAINASHSVQLTAYDRVSVTVPGSDKPDPTKPISDPANAGVPAVDVDVQPSDDAARVVLFAITSDRYSSDLVYSVDGGASDIALDNAHLILGPGAMALLGAAPQKVSIRNGMGNDANANITILAGRQATA